MESKKFLILLIAAILAIVISPIMREVGGIFSLIMPALLGVGVPIASLYAFSGRRRVNVVLIALSTLIVAFTGLSGFASHIYFAALHLVPAIVLYLIVIAHIIKRILTADRITGGLIYGAISTYLLVGIFWSALYKLIELFSPGSFSGTTGETDLLYFSLTSLTTLGLGDISPVTVLAQRLAVLEAAAGTIYIGVIIALIVGKYIAQQIRNES